MRLMNFRYKTLIGLLAGLLVVTAVLIFVAGSPFRIYRGVSPKSMREVIAAQLPAGSEVATVIAFLDANHIEHAAYSIERHDIGAIKRNVCLALLLECSIEMRFFFDSDGRLQRVTVEEGFTGL
jgi:hypothetical protein